MHRERIKSFLLNLTLTAYNAVAALALHILMWRNGLWRPERWTALRERQRSKEAETTP
jgi:hypothetical protein